MSNMVVLRQHIIVRRDSEIAPASGTFMVGVRRDSEIAPTSGTFMVGGNSDSRLLLRPSIIT